MGELGMALFETALKEGQKAAANFGVKVATVVAAAVASKVTCNAINKNNPSLMELPEDQREGAAMKRTIRDASITAAYTMVGALGFALAKEAIEASDVIM